MDCLKMLAYLILIYVVLDMYNLNFSLDDHMHTHGLGRIMQDVVPLY